MKRSLMTLLLYTLPYSLRKERRIKIGERSGSDSISSQQSAVLDPLPVASDTTIIAYHSRTRQMMNNDRAKLQVRLPLEPQWLEDLSDVKILKEKSQTMEVEMQLAKLKFELNAREIQQ